MKKIFGLALLCLTLTACSDDDIPKKATVSLDQLNKKWYYVATWVNGQKTDYDGHLPCGKDYLEFLNGDTVKNVDWTNCQQDPTTLTGTYTVDAENNKIITIVNGETITYTITKLNSKELEVESTYNGLKIGSVFTSIP